MEPKFFGDTNLLELIVDASPAAMIICDEHGRIVLSNRQSQEYFGYTEEELANAKIEMLIPTAHRSAHLQHRARYLEHPEVRSMAAGHDLYAVRKDQSEFPADISLHPIHTKDGVLVLAYILDATDRKRAKEAMEARQTLEKLALLGQLAGGVAHEIRTPLCVIGNASYYLQMVSDRLDPEGVNCIEEIRREVAKADRIVRELLDFTRDATPTCSPVSINDIVSASVDACPAKKDIELQVDLLSEDVQVLVDREQIERLLINLIRNAYEALPDYKGNVVITIRTNDRDVSIDVADNGVGVPRENAEKIFEPLFTTRTRGIGLGLTVSRRYAQKHGGSLSLVDDRSQGARFRLTLPILQADNGALEERPHH